MTCGLPVRMFTAGEFIFATRKRPDRYTATFSQVIKRSLFEKEHVNT